jgi:hypothetical protein
MFLFLLQTVGCVICNKEAEERMISGLELVVSGLHFLVEIWIRKNEKKVR